MISKGKAIAGSSQALNYAMNKEKGFELDRQGISEDTAKGIFEEMKLYQRETESRVKNRFVSIIISPSKEKDFTNEELRKIVKYHLKAVGLENNQYIACVHTNTDDKHVHIIANRITPGNKVVNDQFLSNRLARTADNYCAENGLKNVKELMQDKQNQNKLIIDEIKKGFNFSMKNTLTYDNFKERMFKNGIEVKEFLNTKGEIQGLKYHHLKSGLEVKASQVGKNFGMKNILSKLEVNTMAINQVYNTFIKGKDLSISM